MGEERNQDARRRAPHGLARQLEEGDGAIWRPPVLLVEGVFLQQLRQRHLEDLDDLTGMRNEVRQRVDDPDEGRDREARPDGRERVELGDDLDRGGWEAALLL